MIEIYGNYGCAHVFAENVDQETYRQVRTLMDSPLAEGSTVRVMPDCHAGAGCVIGLTMTLTDVVCPNLVGVDIGCGMLATKLAGIDSLDTRDFERLDDVISRYIPSGFAINSVAHIPSKNFPDLGKLRCKDAVDLKRALLSVGTLGGGNHFIEVAQSQENGDYWLIIHSGSRKLGLEIAAHYQKKAKESCEGTGVHRDLAYLTDVDRNDYLHDMELAQSYAWWNRYTMSGIICDAMDWGIENQFTTTHNYIDLDQNILRKGAVSALRGQPLLIPMNMRDGSLLCLGKGNEDWNKSAPHGAGRIMSRSQAKKVLDIHEYSEQMQGVYTTCVSYSTIDESPMAYKDSTLIEMLIDPTVEVQEHLVPVYNFKAGGE